MPDIGTNDNDKSQAKNLAKNPPHKIDYVEDIYKLAKGGATEIAFKLGVQTRTVENWTRYGIPDKYWKKLYKIYGVTSYQCFCLNAKLRGYKA